jgi:hypothetical protein
MDPLTRLMGKTSLVYLGTGFILGGVLLAADGFGATWTGYWATTHAHILFVGWFVQFALGIAYWLLPRRKTLEKPYGYNPTFGYIAYGLINTGLVIRIILEPMRNAGWLEGAPVTVGLTLSGVLQAIAGIIWVSQIRGRFFLRYSASNRPVKKSDNATSD